MPESLSGRDRALEFRGAYRRYVVNHETGHALGYPHVGCPGSGRLAPVMLQQTRAWPAVGRTRGRRG